MAGFGIDENQAAPAAPQAGRRAAGAAPAAQPQQIPFNFQPQAPGPGAVPSGELGFLGNTGTIIQLLGTLGGDPGLSGFGKGLLGLQQGLQKREFDKQSAEAKNREAQQKFETLRTRAESGAKQTQKFVDQGLLESADAENINRLFGLGQNKEANKILNDVRRNDRAISKLKATEFFKQDLRTANDAFSKAIEFIEGGATPEDAVARALPGRRKAQRDLLKGINARQKSSDTSIFDKALGLIRKTVTGAAQLSPSGLAAKIGFQKSKQPATPVSTEVQNLSSQLGVTLGPDETLRQSPSTGQVWVFNNKTGQAVRQVR